MEEDRDAHFGFGVGWYGLKPKGGENVNFYGATLGGGFEFAKSSIGQVRFNFDLGLYYHQKDYSYDYGYGYENENLEVTALAVPLLFTPAYEFNLSTPKARLRLGAVLGGTWLYLHTDFANAFVFTYGGTVGFTYTPSKSFYMDLDYRFLGNTEAKFRWDDGGTSKMKSTAHQVEFTVGWRF